MTCKRQLSFEDSNAESNEHKAIKESKEELKSGYSKLQQVLGIVWPDIGRFSTKSDLKNFLIEAIPHQVTLADIDFHYSKKDTVDQVILHLSRDKEFSALDPTRVPAYVTLFNRARDFPNHPEHSLTSLLQTIKSHRSQVEKIEAKEAILQGYYRKSMEYLAPGYGERVTLLKEILAANGQSLSPHSILCRNFVELKTCACVEEVVACMILYNAADGKKGPTDEYFKFGYRLMKKLVFTGKLDGELASLSFIQMYIPPSRETWILAANTLKNSKIFWSHCRKTLKKQRKQELRVRHSPFFNYD